MTNNKTAVLLMAYGTPRSTEEILPYYTDIRRGRVPTPEQLADLTARYDAIGGISPLAARTEAQRDALQLVLHWPIRWPRNRSRVAARHQCDRNRLLGNRASIRSFYC